MGWRRLALDRRKPEAEAPKRDRCAIMMSSGIQGQLDGVLNALRLQFASHLNPRLGPASSGSCAWAGPATWSPR